MSALKRSKSKFLQRIYNLYRYRDLFTQLVQRDIKLKYRRSFLGYIWSVLNPLLIMTIQAIVFTRMFSRNIEYFPAFLITGNILFSFMRESTTQSIQSITGNASLLKKTYVPKYIFSLSKVSSSLVNMFFSFGAMLLVLLFTGVPITWYWLLFFIPIIFLYFFCLGLSLFLAQASVFFRDIQYIWSVVTTAWMYLTPIFYDAQFLGNGKVFWAISHLNPMYFYITIFRDFMIYGMLPDWALVIRSMIAAILMMIIGIWSFARNKDKLILYI